MDLQLPTSLIKATNKTTITKKVTATQYSPFVFCAQKYSHKTQTPVLGACFKRYENIRMKYFILLAVFHTLISGPVYSQEEWDVYALSGDGESEYKFSTCYPRSYFSENIAPLDGEMAWDARDKPKLDVNISLVGKINNVEYFDIIQQYQGQRQIKVIAFSNTNKELCPFYAWQPVDGYVEELSSKITSAKGSLVVGHSLKVYRRTYHEFFSINNGLPSRLKLIEIAGEYIKKNYPGHYIRINKLDIENLVYSIKLAKQTDAGCCPTGKSIKIFFTLTNGQVEIVNVEEET